MMQRIIFIIGIITVYLLPSMAQDGQRLFDSEVYQARFQLAKRLNSQGHYIEAYDSLRVLHRDIIDVINKQGLTPATVTHTKDFVFYQNVISSEAECAYMNNLWQEMESANTELINAINERYDNETERNSDYYLQIASSYKIRGDYNYVCGASNTLRYGNAEDNYKQALCYYDLAGDYQAKSKVYAELAQLEYTQENYEEALEYMELAIGNNTSRRASGSNAKESYSDADNLTLDVTYQSALAMCQARNNEFRTALKTIDATINRLPKNDSRIPELKRRRAKILLLQNEMYGSDIQDAGSLYVDYFKSIKDYVNNNLIQMTADQREEYWMLQRPFVVDCYMLEDRNPELLYDVTLYNKGMLLKTACSFDDLLYDGSKKGQINERKLMNERRQQDAQNALRGLTTTLAQDYEKNLLHTMNADGRRKKFFAPLSYTWKNIQKALPADGCAIEFIDYEKQGDRHFGALVLTKIGKPRFVHVCNASSLGSYYPGNWLFTLKYSLSSASGYLNEEIYTDEVIRDSIWNRELIASIGNCSKVYFSPDGYLHLLAIEYMLPEKLADKKFYRLSSTRVLAEKEKVDQRKIRNGAAFVLGGIVYDSSFDNDNHHDPGNDAKAFLTLQKNGSYFSYMKGAKIECDSIIFYRNNPADLYLDSLNATEQAFYKNCSHYPIMHISTHGCFNGDNYVYDQLFASSSKDVLSESVMALSNAGTHLRDNKFDAFNKDGIISAREIARLNLGNVELVTTSACQTGLGYITADGIYGMQRGFKSAGAKGMVMTLWSVNIESARIFFTSFYKYIAEGESVHTAFNHAREDLITKAYTESTTTKKFSTATLSSRTSTINTTKRYNTPQHTNPYILVDVWE